jgi:hypothetical protein
MNALLTHILCSAKKRLYGVCKEFLRLTRFLTDHRFVIPRFTHQEEVAAAAGYEANGGFNNALGRLSTLS